MSLLRAESINPNKPQSSHHSSALREMLLIISCSHSLCSGLSNQTTAALGTSEYSLFYSTLWKSQGHGVKRRLKETCYEKHQWLFWHKAFFPEMLPFTPEKRNKKRTKPKTNNTYFLSNFCWWIFNQIISNGKSQLNFENISFLYNNTPVFTLLVMNVVSACLQLHRNHLKRQQYLDPALPKWLLQSKGKTQVDENLFSLMQ